MNFYIQGDAANADQIKAAFEKLGYDTITNGWNFNADCGVYFTNEADKLVDYTHIETFVSLIKTHPDYKELELPKPHYDIAKFKPKQWVLTRDTSEWDWELTRFAYLNNDESSKFTCINGITFKQCIPFNDYTKHLLGTTNMCNERFINW